jgi:arylsulfatase A-like enzyme
MTQPDIILIVLDTLRRDHLSSYGEPRALSPAFDRFSEGGVLFERAISPAQWTIPAHTSIFTGLYPTSHQVTQSYSQIPAQIPTLAEILRVNGYQTMGFSNNPLVGILNNGLTRGFDHFFNYAGAAPNRPQDMTRPKLQRTVANSWGKFARMVSQQFAKSDDLFRVSLHPLLTPIWTRGINYKGHTIHSVDDMIASFKAHRQTRTQPRFTFFNLMGAHLPYRPPRDFLREVAPDVYHDRSAYRWMGRFNADAVRWASPTDNPLTEEEHHILDAFYSAEIAYQDYHLGRLLDSIQQAGALADSVVVIMADHGEGHGDHDFAGHSFVVYQELVHVPLLIHYPARFSGGQRVEENISTRRLFHTILDVAGIADESLSLASVMEGGVDEENNRAFSEAIPPQTMVNLLKRRQPDMLERFGIDKPRRAIYSNNIKLVTLGEQVEGVFDVAHDPAEKTNLASQQDVTDLKAQLSAFIQEASDMQAEYQQIAHITDDMMESLRALGYVD